MIAVLQPRLKAWADHIDALSLRERGLVFAAVMAVLYAIAVNLVFGPLRAEQATIEKELAAKRNQVQTIENQIQTLVATQGASPQSRVQALRERLATLDAHVDQATVGLVPPREMARLVEQMLRRNKGLELVRLESLAPVALGDVAGGAPAVTPAAVYKHGMRIELKGRYFDIVEYLKTLEGLPWKVYWGEIALETDVYPVSKVRLVIYTLSRNPSWIGV